MHTTLLYLLLYLSLLLHDQFILIHTYQQKKMDYMRKKLASEKY